MKTTLHYDHYYTYDEYEEALRQLQALFPSNMALLPLSKTLQGRTIWGVELTDSETGPCSTKPALYFDGTHHATEYLTTMMSLYAIDTLLTDSDNLSLLQHTAFYCIPCVSPDGMEAALTNPAFFISLPFVPSQDASGLIPEDIDGDGVIRMMRVPSSSGIWKEDPTDSRLLTPRLPYETAGTFFNVYTEGVLQNWDGTDIFPAEGYNSLLMGGDNLNRNYPYAWQSSHGSGDAPLSHVETKTVAEFLRNRSNICWVASLHAPCGLYFYPPNSFSQSKMAPEDLRRYQTMGSVIQQMSSFRAMNPYDGILPAGSCAGGGTLIDWTHFTLGIPSCTIEFWDAEARAGKPHDGSIKPLEEEIAQYQRILDWDQNQFNGAHFKPWTPFSHPQLGDIEIGGIDAKGLLEAPPESILNEYLAKDVSLLLIHAQLLPHLAINNIEYTKLDGDTWNISATIENTGWLPTYLTAEAKEKGINRSIAVHISNDSYDICDTIESLAGFSNMHVSASIYGFGGDSDLSVKHNFSSACKVSKVITAPIGSTITIKAMCPTAGTASANICLHA